MAYVQGAHRLQSGLFCLEDFIATEAPVRVVDALCEQIDLYSPLKNWTDFQKQLGCFGFLRGIGTKKILEGEGAADAAASLFLLRSSGYS